MATLEIGQAEDDKLLLHDPAIKQGTGCVSPVVTLEFSGRRPESHTRCCAGLGLRVARSAKQTARGRGTLASAVPGR
jgi:hypothetical protein